MGFTKVCLIGATGLLVNHILRHFRRSTNPKFDISVLTRFDTSDNDALQHLQDENINVHKVDYNDHDMLVQALKGVEVIVSALNAVPAVQIDPKQLSQKLEKVKVNGSVKENFVLPVGFLNLAAVDKENDKTKSCGAGLLEDGLSWNAGGFLTQKRKTLVEIAREVLGY